MKNEKLPRLNSKEILKVKNEDLIRRVDLDIFTLSEAVLDGSYITDSQGLVIYTNKWYSEITGIPSEEVIGKKIQDVLNEKYSSGEYIVMLPEYNPKASTKSLSSIDETKTKKPLAIYTIVLQEKKQVHVMATVEAHGKSKKLLFIGIPILGSDETINYVLTIIREITEMANLEKKLSQIEIKKRSQQYDTKTLSLKNTFMNSDLIGEDPSIEKLRQLINYVAKTDATVLITGETGTGKEVVARDIYKNSNRNTKPYITVNCAAIPENLLESELFGYEKGAFTGATLEKRLGYFEQAEGGTILLDEIGEMPMQLQSKLLRVLQEREIQRLGGTKTIPIDVRVLAATNQNIDEQIKKGTFREDLFYRLNIIPIKIPPLRERKRDISLLSHYFLENFNTKYSKNKKLKVKATDVLEQYQWPGNIRQLKNTIERLVIIGDEDLISASVVSNVLGKAEDSFNLIDQEESTLKEITNLVEKKVIENALNKYKSSHKAAKALGVSQPTILRKAKMLGIEEW